MKITLSIVAAFAVSLFALLASDVMAHDERPNILFLFADDQRADTIAAHGNPHIATPHLDALAARGISFRRNYCMGSIHGAVCQPSRAMLLSGRSLYRVRMDMKGTTTMPESLRRAGYTTFATGKWHNGAAAFERVFDRGRSVFLGGMSNHVAVPIRDVGPDGKLGPKRVGDGFSTTLFVDSAIEFLRGQSKEQPFFAYVSFTSPHDPRQPPEPFLERYRAEPPPLPRNFMYHHPFNNGWLTGRDERLAPWPRPRGMIIEQLAEYYGMITHLDAEVGRLLAVLEETGHAKNTIIVYAADHGLALGSHGLLGKQSLYEHSMRCPLILAGPGIPAARTSHALTYLFDLFPTLCDLAGVDAPRGLDGESLKPILTGKETSVRDTLFTTYEDLMRAVRDDRWKLIRYPQIHHTQLFDLERDPDELENLADRPEHRERVGRMIVELRRWQKATDDGQTLTANKRAPFRVDLRGRPRKSDRWQPEWIRRKYFGER